MLTPEAYFYSTFGSTNTYKNTLTHTLSTSIFEYNLDTSALRLTSVQCRLGLGSSSQQQVTDVIQYSKYTINQMLLCLTSNRNMVNHYRALYSPLHAAV